jgi:hypothetical protein
MNERMNGKGKLEKIRGICKLCVVGAVSLKLGCPDLKIISATFPGKPYGKIPFPS